MVGHVYVFKHEYGSGTEYNSALREQCDVLAQPHLRASSD